MTSREAKIEAVAEILRSWRFIGDSFYDQAEEVVDALTEPDTEPDPDTRCPHHTPVGQCLGHQGHQGDHQPPERET